MAVYGPLRIKAVTYETIYSKTRIEFMDGTSATVEAASGVNQAVTATMLSQLLHTAISENLLVLIETNLGPADKDFAISLRYE